MFEHIERLRKKSDAEKLRVVLGISAGITLLIAVFWGIAVAFRIESGSLSFKVNASQDSKIKSIGSKITNSWGDFFPSVTSDAATQTPASAEPESPYQVLLGAPEPVEPESAYPADVY
jgi:cytoskeletal protein RodZ